MCIDERWLNILVSQRSDFQNNPVFVHSVSQLPFSHVYSMCVHIECREKGKMGSALLCEK